MASPGQTFLILVSLRKLKFKFIFFLMQHNVSAIKNQSLFLCHVLSFRDNLTSLSRNSLLLSNFKNLFFALKHVFWSKITILQIFDCLVGHTTKKEKKKYSSRETSQTSAQSRRTDRASDSSRLCFDNASTMPHLRLDYAVASISCEHCRSSRNHPHCVPRHIIYYSRTFNFSKRD